MSMLMSTIFPLILSAAPAPQPAVATAHALPGGANLVRVQAAAPAKTPAPPAARPATPQAPAAASPAPAIDRAAVVDKVGQALSAVKTAQGKFTQVDQTGSQSAGAFYISRPGKVRFDYATPEPMYVISDGVSVSVEEPKRASYDAVPLASTPLHLFLRNNVDLKRDGSVTNVTSSSGSYFVTMEDKSGEAQGRMVLEFRVSDFELLGWTAVDAGGGQTKVRLAETQTNVTLKPSLFIVKDPADKRDNRR